MMPCLARCSTGRHVCVMADGHPGGHAAPGHIWDTPSPPRKRAEVWCLDGQWLSGIDHQPSRHVFMRHRAIGDRKYALDVTEHPTHAAALAHALAEVGHTEKNTEKEN